MNNDEQPQQHELAKSLEVSVEDPSVTVSDKSSNYPLGQTQVINLNRIDTADQVRTDFDDESIDELADSIRSIGQRNPIEVIQTEDERFLLITGERRYRALKRLGRKEALVIFISAPESIIERSLLQLTENIQRENLKPLELARELNKLADEGWTGKEIAKKLGKSEPWVSRYQNLKGLPDFIKALLADGKTTDVILINSLRKINESSPKKARELAAKVAKGEIGRQQVVQIQKDLKNLKKSKTDQSEEKPSISQERIDEVHYNRKSKTINSERLLLEVEASLEDKSKVKGHLLVDRVTESDTGETEGDWCWILQENGKEVCVKASTVKIKKFVA